MGEGGIRGSVPGSRRGASRRESVVYRCNNLIAFVGLPLVGMPLRNAWDIRDGTATSAGPASYRRFHVPPRFVACRRSVANVLCRHARLRGSTADRAADPGAGARIAVA